LKGRRKKELGSGGNNRKEGKKGGEMGREEEFLKGRKELIL